VTLFGVLTFDSWGGLEDMEMTVETIETVETPHGTRKHIVQQNQDDLEGYVVYCGEDNLRGETEEYENLDGVKGICGNCRHIYESSRH
jgi:hypothetical protein